VVAARLGTRQYSTAAESRLRRAHGSLNRCLAIQWLVGTRAV
jgi:hypothetical protein